MEMTAIAIGGLALASYLLYGFGELSPMKYALLRAMATQSASVNRALREVLCRRVDDKLRNRDFRRLEKVYLAGVNTYLLRHGTMENARLRRSILRNEHLTL